MAKKYHVRLTEQERERLQTLIKTRSAKSIQVKRAYMLLAADEEGEKQWSDDRICETYHVGRCTIERLRQRFVEEGFDVALKGKTRDVFKEKVFDGTVEAHLVALRCSAAPEGRSRWTLHLLADKMVELEYVETISHESVRQILKKTRSSPGASSRG
jgi:transposase